MSLQPQGPKESSKNTQQHCPPTASTRGLCAGATAKFVNCLTQKPLRSNIMHTNCLTQKPLLFKYNAPQLPHPESFVPPTSTGIKNMEGPFLLPTCNTGKNKVIISGRKTVQLEFAMSTQHSELQFSQWRRFVSPFVFQGYPEFQVCQLHSCLGSRKKGMCLYMREN